MEPVNSISAVGIWFHSLDTKRNLFLMRNDKKYKGHWGLPGGKIEEDESLIETIHRECLEEMGVVPDYIKLVPIDKFTADANQFCYHTFFCLVNKEFIPDLNHEHIGYAWVDADTIPKPLHPGFWATLKDEDIFQRIETLTDLYK